MDPFYNDTSLIPWCRVHRHDPITSKSFCLLILSLGGYNNNFQIWEETNIQRAARGLSCISEEKSNGWEGSRQPFLGKWQQSTYNVCGTRTRGHNGQMRGKTYIDEPTECGPWRQGTRAGRLITWGLVGRECEQGILGIRAAYGLLGGLSPL